MRQRIGTGVVAGLGLLLAGVLAGSPAGAEQYNLAAAAGPEGDAHENNDDPSVAATYSYSDANGGESYEAGADLTQGGSLFASAFRSGAPAIATGSPRAAAGFSETIFIDEVPSGPIQVRASFGVNVQAQATGGFGAVASANARLTLNAFAGSCTSAVSAHSVNGYQDLSSCSAADSSASAGGVELTVTPDQLASFNYQIYIDGAVEAKMDGLLVNLEEGSASAAGGAGFTLARSLRGTEVVPGVVYIEIDPPIAHHYVGDLTSFPVLVPEPGAPLLLAAGTATLALASGRRQRRG